MSNIKLTLIQTSQNRLNEVRRFVESLNKQTNISFCCIQYIFVDQGNNKSAFLNLNKDIEFDYIQIERCSLSHARNFALERVKGKYVAFPDDDCWYESDTLFKVFSALDERDLDGISGIGYNDKGILTSTFPKKSSVITKTNLCAAISYTLFLRFEINLRFDENIGVGSPYKIGSGEESDYLLTLLEQYDYRVYYDNSIVIYHPAESDAVKDCNALLKAYMYARGDGYLLKKHRMPFSLIVIQLLRPLVGLLFFLFLFKLFESKRSYYRLKGRIEGLMFKLQ